MSTKFVAFVNQKEDGGWEIKLTDTFDGKEVLCNNLQEFKKKLEDMGAEYGNDIEVEWKKSALLTPVNYNELNKEMAKLKEEYKDEIENISNKDK
jgi:hypothetical protein